QYGYGWIFGEAPGLGPFYRHDGGQAGTTTQLLVLPEQRVAVAMLSNVYDLMSPLQKATWDLANAAAESVASVEE
ncbi:MAG: serine hydrolase, partial [Candidatus Hydrogenedentales bacterium]